MNTYGKRFVSMSLQKAMCVYNNEGCISRYHKIDGVCVIHNERSGIYGNVTIISDLTHIAVDVSRN